MNAQRRPVATQTFLIKPRRAAPMQQRRICMYTSEPVRPRATALKSRNLVMQFLRTTNSAEVSEWFPCAPRGEDDENQYVPRESTFPLVRHRSGARETRGRGGSPRLVSASISGVCRRGVARNAAWNVIRRHFIKMQVAFP